MNPKGIPGSKLSIKQIVRRICTELPKVFSDLFALDTCRQFQSVAKRRGLEAHLRRLAVLIRQVELMKSPPLSEEERIKTIFRLVDELFHRTLGAPRGEDVFRWLARSFRKVLISADARRLRRTRFREYLRAVDYLVLQIIQYRKREAAERFLDEVMREEATLIIQPIFRRGNLSTRRVDRNSSSEKVGSPSMQDAQGLCESYMDLSGVYEKLLCILLGLIQILQGKQPDYTALRRNSLGENINTLRRHGDLSVLIEGFNRRIRNAIAHGNIQFLIIEKKIKFIDRSGHLVLSPRELLRSLKELGARRSICGDTCVPA